MIDPFATYGLRATSVVPPPLIGPIKRRAEARERYAEIVTALSACGTKAALQTYLDSISAELAQFAAELEFLWVGGDEFPGLEHEIAWATARVDDRLDLPRWEPSHAASSDAAT